MSAALLLLKARPTQPVSVLVAGHTRGDAYVAPHTAIRHKAADTAASMVHKFVNECLGSHDRQTDCELSAYDAHGQQLGYISTSDFEGTLRIEYIWTDPDKRRLGIATAMLAQLHKEYPGRKIAWSNTTADGTKLRNSQTTRLYRGDSKAIPEFALGATNPLSLFGQAIYLTNDKRVAADYTTKGASNVGDVLFRVHSRKPLTKAEVIDAYVERQARTIDTTGSDHSHELEYWGGKPIPFTSGRDWSHVNFSEQDNRERAARLAHARARWDAVAKDYEVRIKLDNTAVIQHKQQRAKVTAVDVPDQVLADTLDAEAEIDNSVLDTLCGALEDAGDNETARDIRTFVRRRERGEDEDDPSGYRPTFREIYTSITAGSPLASDPEVQAEFRQALAELGYTGIEYAGGLSMGGGHKHRAYAIWDADLINAQRVQGAP